MKVLKKGIDISKWQGSINAKRIKADGVEFAILRSGYSTTVDPKFYTYVSQFKKAGVDIVGVYHFSYAKSVAQAKKEAEFCLKVVKKAKLDSNIIIFYDFEGDTVRAARKAGITLGKTECNAYTKAFCEEIEKSGYKAGVYFNINYYKNWFDHDLLNKYVKWLADYSGSPNYDCAYHQYTNKGSVSGISGNVDMNYFYGLKEIKSVSEVTVEILAGLWGNGDTRKQALEAAGYDYSDCQTAVNKKIADARKKTTHELAVEVILEKWGRGSVRKRALEAVGACYEEVQTEVNRILKSK